MLYPPHSRYVPDPGKQAVQIFHDVSFDSHQPPNKERKMNLVLPRWFSYIFLEFLYGSLMKLHIEWQYEIRLYQYQQGLQSLLSLLYQIIILVLVMWMLHWWCLFNICLFVHICYKLFDERPWYHVLGLLVVSLGPDGYAERQQCAPSWIGGLLPSTSLFDMIDGGPTSVNVNYSDTHENTTGLSCGLPQFLMMKVPCLSRR